MRYGIERVVTISALGREEQRYAGHVSASLAMDDLLRSTGAHLRALTMPSFMDNMLWQAPSIKRRCAQEKDLRSHGSARGDLCARRYPRPDCL